MRRLALVLLLAACGDDIAAEPVFDEVCGAAGPHRLLALAPGEVVRSLREIDGRIYYVAGPRSPEAPLNHPTTDDPTVYSAGPCGEDPRTVAPGVRAVLTHERWPGAVLGCAGDDLVALDPTGAAAPRPIAPVGCMADFTAHGLVRSERFAEDRARLLLYRYSDDPAATLTPEVLLPDIQPLDPLQHRDADEVVALDPDGALLRVALADGEVTTLQTGVRAWDVSRDRRYLVWQDLAVTDQSFGQVTLRDRVTGVDTVLAPSGAVSGSAFVYEDDLVRLYLPPGQLRLVHLPTLAALDVPDGAGLIFRIRDGRWATTRPDGAWALVDVFTGTATPLTADVGTPRFTADALELRLGATYADWRVEGELWRYPYDGSPPQQLAARVSGSRTALSDGRVVTALDMDDEWLGTLTMIDADLAEHPLAERVLGLFSGATTSAGGDTVIYVVDDGDRSGVWLARPLAAPGE